MSAEENHLIDIFKGDKAIKLWLKGKDAWNAMVKEYPDAYVDFSNVDFSQYGDINFDSFIFPTGYVSFDDTQFGKGNVSFDNAQFGDSYVNFCSARFGEGEVSFEEAQFGDGNVSFDEAQFGDGNVSFDYAQFGDGYVSFYDAKFGDGYVRFDWAKFGEGNVSFIKAKFGDGEVSFDYTQFGDGEVSFAKAYFGDGEVSFKRAKFEKINFEYADFKGRAIFGELVQSDKINSLSFRFASFDKALDVSGNDFGCVPDLTHTKTAHHIGLDSFSIKINADLNNTQKNKFYKLIIKIFKIKNSTKQNIIHKFFIKYLALDWVQQNTVTNKRDIASIKRLKEIAENNKDRKMAIDFHAQELQAKRWVETTKKLPLLLQYLFEVFSDYGRSAMRPFAWLGIIWFIAAIIYNCAAKLDAEFGDAMVFSFAQILPFISSAFIARQDALKALFGCAESFPNWLYLITATQSIISIVLLFLLGLALRNRFRI